MKYCLGISLILITLAGVVWFGLHLFWTSIDRRVDSVREAFTSVLQVQPQISVCQIVILDQEASIAELAVLNREQLIISTENLQGDTLSFQPPKLTTAFAKFRIAAGFDLNQPFLVRINPITHNIRVMMPHAKILSVEQMGEFSVREENSWPVDSLERTQITDHLKAAAYKASKTFGLKEDVEKQVEQRLTKLLADKGQTLEVEWSTSLP